MTPAVERASLSRFALPETGMAAPAAEAGTVQGR